jgi:hypothetical protein
MTYLNNEKRVKYLIDSLDHNSNGYLVTLTGISDSREKFENHLLSFSTWLNDYSLGKNYQRKLDRLEIFGSIERGQINNRLHAHLIIKDHEKVRRSDQELNAFARKSWIKLTQAKASPMSRLIDFQRAHDLKAAATYALKEVRSNFSDNLLYI